MTHGQLPPPVDVLARLRMPARAGGVGIMPSGAVHLELPTTIVDRRADAVGAMPRLVPR
jgi:hypothetical protein